MHSTAGRYDINIDFPRGASNTNALAV
jgi:hypothetical protein